MRTGNNLKDQKASKLQEEEEHKAAVRIQANFRGYQVRKKIDAERTKDAPKEKDAEALANFPFSEFASKEIKEAESKVDPFDFA